MPDDRNDRILARARRIAAEEGAAPERHPAALDPATLAPEEAETVRANQALKAAARDGSRPNDAGMGLRPDLGELPPAD